MTIKYLHSNYLLKQKWSPIALLCGFFVLIYSIQKNEFSFAHKSTFAFNDYTGCVKSTGMLFQNGISQDHEILYTFLSQCKATILKISRVQISINDLIKDKNLVLKVVHLALLIFLLKTALNELKCNWKFLWKSYLLFLSDL